VFRHLRKLAKHVARETLLAPTSWGDQSDLFIAKRGPTTEASRLYELTRNGRIRWDLADQHPFRLVNFGPPTPFSKKKPLASFEKSLARATDRLFLRVTRSSLLHSIVVDLGGLPRWLEDWLDQRSLGAPAVK